VTKTLTIGGSVVLATVVGAALLLRPRPVAHEEHPVTAALAPAARQVVRTKMARHDLQMRELLTRVVLLDDDGVARVGGEVSTNRLWRARSRATSSTACCPSGSSCFKTS